MDRKNFPTDGFKSDNPPTWRCPICGSGAISLVPKSFEKEETSTSKSYRSHDEWNPDWVGYTFVAKASCSNPRCGQQFVSVGDIWVEGDFDPEQGEIFFNSYHVRYCNPPVHCLDLSENWPEPVRDLLKAAFALYWSDPDSCANRIRASIEELLNCLAVKKCVLNRHRKRAYLCLHQRIEEFKKQDGRNAGRLLALKLIGNTGSHGAAVSRDDLLDAFEILETVLQDIFDKKDERVEKLVKNITKRHGK